MIINIGGTIRWYESYKGHYYGLHRLDGPAIEKIDGSHEWYYCGEKIDCSSTEEFIRIVNLRVFW